MSSWVPPRAPAQPPPSCDWDPPLNTAPQLETPRGSLQARAHHPAPGRERSFRLSDRPDLVALRAPPPGTKRTLTWVPLPAPGGPSNTARMPLGYSGSEANTLGAMSTKASPPASCTPHGSSASRPAHSLLPALVARGIRQFPLPAPEPDGHFPIPIVRRDWKILFLIGQNWERGRGGPAWEELGLESACGSRLVYGVGGKKREGRLERVGSFSMAFDS